MRTTLISNHKFQDHMDILKWLARAAGFDEQPRPKGRLTDAQRDRRLAKRSLEARLPPHLLRDIGADDG